MLEPGRATTRPAVFSWGNRCAGSETRPYARAETPLAFAVCVAIKSMIAGERQSYGSRPSCFSLALTAPMLAGSAPDSMMDETNAANSGGDHPCWGDSSV